MAAMAFVARLTFPSAIVVALLASACGKPAEPPQTAHDADPTHDVPPTPPVTPITSIKRADVKAAIDRGLGAFLQNVTVEDWPVMHGGKFHGFKIRTINPEWGIDLRPGDVVTRVNGIVPEHPEEADTALRSLEKATSLKIEFERDGKPSSLQLSIVD